MRLLSTILITCLISTALSVLISRAMMKSKAQAVDISPDHTFVSAATKAVKAVAWIQNQDNEGNIDTTSSKYGAGIIISPEGYIVTNYHVVDGNKNIHVTLSDSRRFLATYITGDQSNDIAVIRIDAPDLAHLEYGDSDSLLVGQHVIAVGNPHRQQSTVQSGIISALNRQARLPNNNAPFFIQTDIPINNGSSGGGMLNVEGQLIGIITGMVTVTGAYEGISLAVPGNFVKNITDQIIAYDTARNGGLNMVFRNVNKDDANAAGLTNYNGITIDVITEGTSADVAGLRSLDIITSWNGEPVSDKHNFSDRMSSSKFGEVVKLGVRRGREDLVVGVKLE
jgi:S1-C subfamily serine protease